MGVLIRHSPRASKQQNTVGITVFPSSLLSKHCPGLKLLNYSVPMGSGVSIKPFLNLGRT